MKALQTITELARQFNISRTTVLYYERAGLLLPTRREDNGYRVYGEKEQQRLSSILSYRSFGVPVAEIASLLESQNQAGQEQLLHNQFNALEDEIQRLRKQQNAIVESLNAPKLKKETPLTKERWTEMMRASGLSDEDMTNWHIQFELMEPHAHQEFLESLGIDKNEITLLRSQFAKNL